MAFDFIITLNLPIAPVASAISVYNVRNAVTSPPIPAISPLKPKIEPNTMPKRISTGNSLISVLIAPAISSMLVCSDPISASLCVICFERSYHACAISLTISTPSGLVNALAQRLLARSTKAAAVWFCIMYSPMTASPSLKASRLVCRCLRRMSARSAIVAITFTSRAPSEPRSLKILPSRFRLPFWFMRSKISTMASIVLPSS